MMKESEVNAAADAEKQDPARQSNYGTLPAPESADASQDVGTYLDFSADALGNAKDYALGNAKDALAELAEQREKGKLALSKMKMGFGKVMGTNEDNVWDKESAAPRLMVDTLINAGYEVAVLLAVAKTILPEEFGGTKGLVRPCLPERIGLGPAIVCEFTKGFVYGFPVLALISTLVVAQSQILSKRAFYVMIQNKGLLHFAERHPFSDAVFRTLVFAFLMSACHFIQNVCHIHGHLLLDAVMFRNVDSVMAAHTKLISLSYFLPASVFMIFFYTSYDICMAVMPLSTFFEDDPEASKQQICELTLIEEENAADFVTQDRVSSIHERFDDADEKLDQVWSEIIAQSPTIGDAPRLHGIGAFMWPAKILLDPRLTDFESKVFRALWATFCPSCLALEVLCICYIFFQIYEVYVAIVQDKRWDDLASLLGLFAVLYLGIDMIISNAFVGLWRLWPNSKEISEELALCRADSASSQDALGQNQEPTETPAESA